MATEEQNKQIDNYSVIDAITEIARDLNIVDFEIINEDLLFTGDNFCGDISFVKLKSKQNEDKTVNLFVKKAPFDERRGALPVQKLYEAEINLYTNIIPAFQKLEEKYISEKDRIVYGKYYKGYNKELEEFLILNDLSTEGFEMRNKRESFDFDHAALVMKNMAKLHSLSFALKQKNPELFSALIGNVTQTFVYEKNIMPVFDAVGKSSVQCIKDPKKNAKMTSMMNNGTLTMRTAMDASLTEPYNVICHGDCWNNNMLFKYQNDKLESMVLIDWQLVRYGCPASDILYVICSSMDVNLLKPHLYTLLDIYYETLKDHLNKMDCDIDMCFPREVFTSSVKRLWSYGFTAASFVFPISMGDPKEVKPIEEYRDASAPAMVVSTLASQRINELLDYLVDNEFI